MGTPCYGQGTCNDGSTNNGTCLCNAGYTGYSCSISLSAPCVTNSTEEVMCSGHGVCDAANVNCLCDNGWGGALCDKECGGNGNECYGHGVCNDGSCDCVIGWDPAADCSVCLPDYSGYSCEFQCPSYKGAVCNGKGTCVQGRCICSENCGTACEIVNGCATDACGQVDQYGPMCADSCGECNPPGGRCDAGKQGTGCLCDSRYGGPSCINRCSTDKGLLCAGNGICDKDKGICSCQPMYYGSMCQTECKCTLLKNTRYSSYPKGEPICLDDGTCDCASSGFVGENCDVPCPGLYEGEPCSGNGECVLDGDVAVCKCNTEWKGTVCSDCADGYFGWNCSMHCVNGINNGTGCVCDASWGGASCEKQCTCTVHGVCRAGWLVDPVCMCDAGWYGANCSVPCDNSACDGIKQCNAEGVCDCTGHFQKGGSNCTQCESGWYGVNCDLECPCSSHGRCDKETGTVCECDLSNGQHWAGQSCEVCEAKYLGENCDVYNHAPKHDGDKISTATKMGDTSCIMLDKEQQKILVGSTGRWVVYAPVNNQIHCPSGFNMCPSNPDDATTLIMWADGDAVYGLIANCGSTGTYIYKYKRSDYEQCNQGQLMWKVSDQNVQLAVVTSDAAYLYFIEEDTTSNSRLMVALLSPCLSRPKLPACLRPLILIYKVTSIALRDTVRTSRTLVLGGVGGAAGWVVKAYTFASYLPNVSEPIEVKNMIGECPRCKVDRVYISNDQGTHLTGDLLFVSFINLQAELVLQLLNITNGVASATNSTRVSLADANWMSTSMHLDAYTGELYVATKKCALGKCTEAAFVRFTTRDGLRLDGKFSLEASAALSSLTGSNETRVLYSVHEAENITLSKFLMYTVRETDPSGLYIEGGIVAIKGTGFAPVGSTVMNVSLGIKEYQGTFLSETLILSTVGKSQREMTGDCEGEAIEVSLTQSRYTGDGIKLRRFDLPVIKEASPAYALESEGGVITLTGSGFADSEYAACRYESSNNDIYYFTMQEIPKPYVSVTNYTELHQGGDQFRYVNPTTVVCNAPVVTRKSNITSLSVTFDGQKFSESVPFAIVGSKNKLGVKIDTNGLTPTADALFPLPSIEVFTLDINGNRVGKESSDTVSAVVNISFIPDNVGTVSMMKCGAYLPNSTCMASVPPTAMGIHNLTLTRGYAVIPAGLFFTCLPLGVVSIYARSVSEHLDPSQSFQIRVTQGELHKLVFKDVESAPPCQLDMRGETFAVVLRFADAAGNVLYKDNLIGLGANHLAVFGDVRENNTRAANTTVKQYQQDLDLNTAAVAFPSIKLDAKQGTEYYMLFTAQFKGKFFELRSNTFMAKNCFDYNDEYYGVAGQVGCMKCPANANCTIDYNESTPVGQILPTKGYWAFENSTRMYKCASVEACPGGATPCAPGSYGPLCSVCESGYGKGSNGVCMKCSVTAAKAALMVFLVLLGFLLFAAYSLYTLQQGISSEKSIIVRMLFSHIQILSNLLSLNIPWDKCTTYKVFHGILVGSDTTNMNIAQVSFVDCVFSKLNFYFLMMASPAVFLPVSVFVYMLAQLISWWQGRGKRLVMPQDWVEKEVNKADEQDKGKPGKKANQLADYPYSNVVIIVGVVVFFMLYQMLAKQSSQLLSCTNLKDVPITGSSHSYNFMTVDMSVNCDRNTFSRIKVIATVFLLAYGLGVPVVLCWSIVQYRRKHSEEATQRVFTFLVGGFRGGMFKFWQSVIMLRKFCIAVVLAFLSGSQVGEEELSVDQERMRVYVVIWVMILFILCQVHFNPYMDPSHNAAESAGQAVLIVTLNLGLLFFLHPDIDSNTDAKFKFVFEIIQVVIIILNLSLFGGFAYLWIRAAEKDVRRDLGLEEGEDLTKAVFKNIKKIAGKEADDSDEEKKKEKEEEEVEEEEKEAEAKPLTAQTVDDDEYRANLKDELRALNEAEKQRRHDERVVDVEFEPASVPAKTGVLLRRRKKPKLGEEDFTGGGAKYHFKGRELEVVGEGPNESLVVTDDGQHRDTITVNFSDIHRFGSESQQDGEHIVNGMSIEYATNRNVVLSFPSPTARQAYLSYLSYRLPHADRSRPGIELSTDDDDDDGDGLFSIKESNPLRPPVMFSSPSLKHQSDPKPKNSGDLLKLIDPRMHPILDDITAMKRTRSS
eukprot:TRINITY_DN8261_c0_g1_i5.p1 TRINITY_DN8261_c0_g1~~TRINITY_DN8261_c0_g1_i5.p1  ORF type:complete len:2478 (+),score=777.96 TRINITY_DN8261_c0_g1_i5:1035-7436(+)